MKSLATTLSLCLLVAASAVAQTPLNVRIEHDANGAKIPAGVTLDVTTTGGLALTVTCDHAADCTGLTATLADAPVILTAPTATTRTATFSASEIGPTTLLKFFENLLPLVTYVLHGTGSGGMGTVTPTVIDPCRNFPVPSVRYADDRAEFYVTPAGSVLHQPTDKVDENDTVVFHVLGSDPAVMQSLEVARTSATRTTGGISILGEGTKIQLQARGAQCIERTFELGDFAPGEGIVELSSVVNNQKTVLGTTKFNVNRLWDGIMSFGPIFSRVTDKKFGLATQADTTKTIIETDDGKNDLLYAMQYTYFAGGRRDIEKKRPTGLKRINPTIGFSLNSPKDHALAGISFDAGQFVFTAGVHYAKVARLSKASGFAVGSKFTGTVAEIPTEKRWESGVYFGVTVDARAAKVLLDSIMPSGGGGGGGS